MTFAELVRIFSEPENMVPLPIDLRTRLLDTRPHGLAQGLRDGLAHREANLAAIESLARIIGPPPGPAIPGVSSAQSAEARAIRLYTCVAARLAAGKAVDDLFREFDAPLVADVAAELETGELRQPVPGPGGGPGAVRVPLMLVWMDSRGNPKNGVAGGLRFEWMQPVPGNDLGAVYSSSRQTAMERDALLEKSRGTWRDAERSAVCYLRDELGGAATQRLSDLRLPVPADVRWELSYENPVVPLPPAIYGDSFGLAFVVGLIQLLSGHLASPPSAWVGVRDLDLGGVLGLAAVEPDGRLRPVGGIYAKLVGAREGFVDAIHTVLAAREARRELEGPWKLDRQGRSAIRDVRFLFAATVPEALRLLEAHLAPRRDVNLAIRRYDEAREAEWWETFADPTEEDSADRPPYIETQGIRLLDPTVNAKEYLRPETFQMPGGENEQRDRSESVTEPWKSIPREELVEHLCAFAKARETDRTWTRGTAEPGDAMRLLCVTHDAGQGKTEFLHWLRRKLRDELPAGYWVVLARAKDLCLKRAPLLELLVNRLQVGAGKGIREDLARRLDEGRIVFLLDGLDEMPAKNSVGLLSDLIDGCPCRFVLAGRPHAIEVHWRTLFEKRPWRFLLLDYFNEEDQRRYLGQDFYRRLTYEIELPPELLAVPRALYYVRSLKGKPEAELKELHSPSAIYHAAVRDMVTKGVSGKGIDYDEAMLWLSAIGFQMVVDGNFGAVERPEMNGFGVRVAERVGLYWGSEQGKKDGVVARGHTPEKFKRALKRLGRMNEGLESGLLERETPDRIQFRNRSLQEFFAGYWLALYCLKEDQVRLRGMLYLDEEEETHDYRWMWRFVAEMPKDESNPKRWVWALEPVYLPDAFPAPEGSPKRKRSTEVIWRSWKTMNEIGKAVIERFRGEFRAMLEEVGHPSHEIATRLVKNFVKCPPNPTDENQPIQMGSPPGEAGRAEDEVQHSVLVSPFRMGKYAVTEEEYGLFEPGKPRTTGLRYPVVDVSWDDAWVYAKWVGHQLSTGGERMECRLPTEAEWEYACRAGTTTAYCFGDDPGRLGEFAWSYRVLPLGSVHPVGEKRANGWGLRDMHGNVWEWCEDWYGEYEARDGKVVVDPMGPASGTIHVSRGGGWWSIARDCRSASRSGDWLRPDHFPDQLGFRLALSSVPFGVSSREQKR